MAAFTDTSTGKPTEWTWDFGDGSVDTISQNPSHSYTTAGTYTVTLTVKNANGSSNKVTKKNYIRVQASRVREK